jgi:hypothetical protein
LLPVILVDASPAGGHPFQHRILQRTIDDVLVLVDEQSAWEQGEVEVFGVTIALGDHGA